RRPMGLIGRLVLVLFSGFLLFFLLTVRGRAPSSFITVALLPLLVGLWSLYMWGRRKKSPEASQTVVKDAPTSPGLAERTFSIGFMVAAWPFFLFVLAVCLAYRSSWTWGVWILVGVLVLCLVLIPVQILRYFRGKQK